MADEVNKRDSNRVTVMSGIDNVSSEIIQARMDTTTKRLKVDIPALDSAVDSVSAAITSIADGFELGTYDYIGATYPDTETEVYTFKTGGSGGTTVGTLTVVFTDSSKEVLTSVTKT